MPKIVSLSIKIRLRRCNAYWKLPKPQKVEVEEPTPVATPQETIELSKEETPIQTEIQTQSKDEGLTTQRETKTRIPVPEQVEPEPKKRGFLSRFFLPNG